MSQMRFNEYFAKVVLESCFPKHFINLQILDKPDLQSSNKIGVEVTNCMPKEAAEAFNLWNRVAKQGKKTPTRILKRLEQLKYIVHFEGNTLIWEQGTYLDGDIDNSPIKEFLNAVAKKEERLNSKNAQYEEMERYELFVISAISIFRPEQTYALLARMRELNNKSKKFDKIYLVTSDQKLFVFDLLNNSFDIKPLYSKLDCMTYKAIELYKTTKQSSNLKR